MKTICLTLTMGILLLAAAAAFAAPSTITLQNFSASGQTNYPVTCSIVGVLDNTDRINDNTERINTASLRTLSLSKGGQKNYSTALNSKGQQFRVACVRNDGTASTIKMFFDNISTYWMSVVAGIYRFY